MEAKVPPRDRQGLRTGFTTGACAAAAAKAAARCLVSRITLTEIETTLPNRATVIFPLRRCEVLGDAHAICSIVKDAGDDPDCTHGAELVADVRLTRDADRSRAAEAPRIEIRGGEGVATVTKPGLGLEVGAPAVNPVPRRNITEMVMEELLGSAFTGAVVTLSVPGGVEMAKETTNARLGLVGGISILGTSGIVKPYSTAAFRASVVQAIDVARERGLTEVVLTTGGKSEAYAMRLFPALAEDAFIQVGDFIGTALRHASRRGSGRALIVGMIGKLSKMADGKMMTHAAGSEVNLALLASIAGDLGADEDVLAEIRAANTARHVLELCAARGLHGLASGVCRRVVARGAAHAGGAMAVAAYLVDFNGALLGQHPETGSRATSSTALAPETP